MKCYSNEISIGKKALSSNDLSHEFFFFFFRKTNAKQKGFHPFELFLPTIIQWVYNLYWFSLNGSAFANKTKMPNGPFRSRHFTTFEKPSTLAQVCECVMSKHEYCLNVHESLIVCRNKKQETRNEWIRYGFAFCEITLPLLMFKEKQ